MARSREVTRLSDIRTHGQLKAMRERFDMQASYAGRHLADGFAATFSVSNLLSLIAPPGSLTDRIIGGVGTVVGGVNTGVATLRAVMSVVDLFRDGRKRRR